MYATLQEETRERHQGVVGRTIHGVAILNSESSNGRFYPAGVIQDAVDKFENVKVYLDHNDGGDGTRSVRDLLGRLTGVYPVLNGGDRATLRGDLEIFAGPDGDRILRMAESTPDAVGLSIRARGDIVPDDKGGDRVARINSVESVDVVDKPAATTGLFESEGRDGGRHNGLTEAQIIRLAEGERIEVPEASRIGRERSSRRDAGSPPSVDDVAAMVNGPGWRSSGKAGTKPPTIDELAELVKKDGA